MAMSIKLSCLVALWLVLCRLSEASYVPVYSIEGQVFYNESGVFRRFPDEDQVAPENFDYFISELNFNAINGSILIGAADTLYRLNHELQLQDDYAWVTDPALLSDCAATGDNPEFACRNHIRVYEKIPANQDLLFVCGTQAAEAPQCRTVDISGGMLGSDSTPVVATDGLISYFPEFPGFGQFRNADPSDTTYFTAGLFDGPNNVGQHFSISYQSINFTNASNPNTLETTENFRTIDANNYWLRFPVTFVDYYEANYEPQPASPNPDEYQFYFIFFRENFYNRDFALDMIYSRVARVCRNDPGTTATASDIDYFSTFLKARIYCQRTVPSTRDFVGAIDFDYNAITSMAFNDEGRYYENGDWIKMMYGAFTSPVNGPSESALCAYRADNQGPGNNGIFDVFRQDVLNNGDDEDTEVPQFFFECDPVGRTSDDAMRRVLITEDVMQIETEPLLILDDIQITQLVLDRVCIVRSADNSTCLNQDVLFLGTDVGKVLKVVFGLDVSGDNFPIVAEEILLDDNGTINRMMIQEVNMTKYLYVSTVSKIYRLPLERCSTNANCSECIGSRDPYCVWNTMTYTCQASTLTAASDAQGSVPNNIHQNVHTGELPSLCDFVTVMFSEASYTFGESDGNITITLVKSGTTNSNATFLLSTADETAAAETDYRPLSDYEVTFAPDEYEKTVDIAIVGDSVLESEESFIVQLTLPLNPSQVGVDTAERNTTRVIITDDDSVTISFQPAEYNVSEVDISVGIIVVKDGSSEIPVSVLLSTVPTGSAGATAPDDYSPRNEMELVFESVNTQLVHEIAVVNDDILENSETFQVALTLPTDQTGVLLGQATADVTIIDNDVVIVGWQAVEYNVSENCGSVSIAVTKQGSNAIPVMVLFSTLDMTASAPDDFNSFTARMVLFESDTLIEIIQVSVINDEVNEPFEYFVGMLTAPTGQTGVQIGDATTTITISDDDIITFELETLTQNASEADGFITATIMKRGATVSNLSVTFSTADSTALASDDYDATSENLLFAYDESQKTVSVVLINDDTVEITETLLGIISLPDNEPGVALGQDTATYAIIDDDNIIVQFESSLYTISEGDAFVNLTIIKTGSNDVELSVLISTSDGNATGLNDYDSIEDQIFFGPTVLQQTISIAINDDQVFEASESFFASLSMIDSQRGVQLGLSDAQVVILDNDVITLEFEQVVCTVSEADGTAELVITKNGLSSDAISVLFSTMNGNASDPDDYTAVDELQVNFDPNQFQQTITISIADDEVFESTEQFSAILVLSDSQNGVQLGIDVVNITILDDDTVTVGFAAAGYTLSESSSSITVAVSRNGLAAIPITLALVTVDGTAAAGVDYTETNVDVMLNFDDSEQSITIPVLNDIVVESQEFFRVELTIASSQSRIQLGQDSATIVIEDDDTVTVQFSSEEYRVSEESSYVNVTLIKTGSNAIDIPVIFNTSDQNATAFDDYGPTEREIIFSPSTAQQIVTIYIRNDEVLETSESFLAALSIPDGQQNVQLGVNTTQIIISDDDVVMVQFEQMSCTVFEGSGVAEIKLTKTGLHAETISILFSTINGNTADSGDYVAVTELEVNFDPNTFQQTVSVIITDDDILESTEDFSASLILPNNQQGVQLEDSIINITIIDDDSVAIGIATADYSISEDAGVVNVTVNKIGSSAIPINVTFVTMDGTAVAVSDYAETNMEITLEPSDTEKIVMVPIVNDDVQEPQESFLVRLHVTQTRVQLARDSSTITVTDDDIVTIELSSPEYNVTEDNGYVNVTLMKNGVSATAIAALFSTRDQTATAPGDYIPIENEILFQPGLNEQLISLVIPITNDELQESPESFLGEITLPGIQPGTRLGQATTLITITDDDRISVGFNATEYTVSEADGTIAIQITKYGATTRAIDVEFSTQDDTATVQDDYGSTVVVVTFAPDSFQETVTVPIVNDGTAEPPQRFYGRLAISNAEGVDLSDAVTSVNIIDDDVVTIGFVEVVYNVSESDVYFNVSIVKDGPTASSISILLIGDAAAEDFTIVDTEISLAADTLEEGTMVQLVDDDIHELTETFQISLSLPNDQEIAVQLNPNTTTVIIRDDDTVTVGFKQANYTTSEDCGSVSITLMKTGSTILPIALQFNTMDGTATAPNDYITSDFMVTFQPSDTEITIAVTLVNDDQMESSESFMGRLVLLNDQERVQLVPDTVVITITGRDADGSTGTVTDGTSPPTVVAPLSVECQFDTGVVAGVIAALVAIIVILILIVIILTCCLAHYKRGQKYDIGKPVSPDLCLTGIGVSNVGFEDTPQKVEDSSPDVESRQEPEEEQKRDIASELKDSPEDPGT